MNIIAILNFLLPLWSLLPSLPAPLAFDIASSFDPARLLLSANRIGVDRLAMGVIQLQYHTYRLRCAPWVCSSVPLFP